MSESHYVSVSRMDFPLVPTQSHPDYCCKAEEAVVGASHPVAYICSRQVGLGPYNVLVSKVVYDKDV